MYIINILVKPSENKNSHRKHCLSVTSGQRCIWSPVNTTHTVHTNISDSETWAKTFFFPPSWHTVPDWLNPRKHCTGIQIQLLSQVCCRRHWNSFIKTLQDRESFTINKRGKTLLLPLFFYKTASYYFIFKVWFFTRQRKLKKTCCDMKSVVRV